MSQSLPKTDSREFEVADSQPTPSSQAVPAPEIETWIRVWNKRHRGFEPVEVSTEAENTLVQMICDLVVAGGGCLHPEPRNLLVALFPSPLKAVAVAKRVQRCVAAFAAGSDESVSVGIAVCAVLNAAEGSDRSSVATNLLDVARPGKIVLTGDVWRQLETVPGLRLRKPIAASGEAESTLRELAWTPVLESSEQRPSELRVKRVAAEAADSDKKFGNDQAATEGPGYGLSEIPESALAEKPALAPSDIFEAAARRSRILIRGGLVVAALLVLVFSTLLFLSSRQNSKARGPAPILQNVPAPPAAVNSSPSSAAQYPLDQREQSPTTSPPVGASADSASVTRTPSSRKTPSRHQDNVARATQNPPVAQQTLRGCSEGYFPSDVPYLLVQADQQAGSGKYAEARHAYQVVLCLDPGNTRAKVGLQKVARAAELNRE